MNPVNLKALFTVHSIKWNGLKFCLGIALWWRTMCNYLCYLKCSLGLSELLQNRYARLSVLRLLSVEPFAHRRNVASWSLFYRNYFGRFSSELAQLVPLPFFRGIPRCYQDVFVNSFFPRTARLWNPLPIECFPLTYDLNCFKSRINRHLFTVGFF